MAETKAKVKSVGTGVNKARGRKYKLTVAALAFWMAFGSAWVAAHIVVGTTPDGVAIGTFLAGGTGILAQYSAANAFAKKATSGNGGV